MVTRENKPDNLGLKKSIIQCISALTEVNINRYKIEISLNISMYQNLWVSYVILPSQSC